MFWKNRKQQRSPLLFEELEPRVLFSADGFGVLAGATDIPDAYPAAHVLVVDSDFKVHAAIENNVQEQGSDSAVQQRLELVFVDSNTPDHELLVADLLGQEDENRRFEVIMLDAKRDGVEQITDVLGQYSGVDAIHIVSHGDEGQVQLGTTTLSTDNLNRYQSELWSWGSALSGDADILIYGCNLAATDAGQSLVNNLASFTSADVAASEDLTGHISLGGDWDLEFHAGVIETDIAFGSDLQKQWDSVLAGSWFDAGTGDPIGSPTTGDDIFVGDGSNDTGIDGSDGNDVLYGGNGDDNLTGGNGDDLILGGDGNDTLDGGNFDDILHGGRGDDIINGGNHADTLIGGGGNDTLNGGDEDDLFVFSGAQSGDFYTVNGGNHNDTIDVSAFESAVYDGSTITVQLGGGDSFTISYTNVEFVVKPGDPGNKAPVADAGPDQTVGTGALVTLDASASSDPDPETPTYSWQQISGPWVTLSNSTAEMPTFTAPGSAAVLEFALVASDASISDVDTVKITVGGPIDTSSLWLSTNGGATATNSDPINAEDIVSFSDPDLELGDGSAITSGTFFREHALAENVRALHYVNTAVTVDTLIGGMTGTYDLQPGQIVVSMRDSFLLGLIPVENTDVLVYTPGGTYEFLLQDAIFKSDGTDPADGSTPPDGTTAANIHAISIVEQDTNIGGDTTLTAGTYLIARSDPAVHADISTYDNANGRQDLLLGGDFLSNSDEQIQGLELLEADLVVGGITVTEGTLLITVQSDGTQLVGTSGSTTVTAEQIDVIALTLNATEQDSGTAETIVDAQIFFDGSDLSLSIASGTEVINGLTLAGNSLDGVNSEPTLTTTASNPTFTEGGAAASLFSGTSVNTVEGGQTLSSLTLTVSDVSDGANEILNIDGTAVALTNANSGTTATSGLSYSVSLSSGTATVSLVGGTLSTAAAQTLVDALSYQNDSSDPDTTNRVITLTQLVDSGGSANGGDDTATLSAASSVTVQAVNSAPTALNRTTTSLYNEGDASVAITDIVVSDVDAGDSITATLTLANTATGSLSENNGATYDTGTGVWAITGTVSIVNTALASLEFIPVGDNDVDTTIGVAIDDGDEDAGGPLTGTITLDVTPAISGAVNTVVPGAQNTNEDTTLVFSTGGGNAVTVDDGSAGDPILRTELSVTNGILTLNTAAGLVFENGADGTSSMTITGLESAINTALDGLTFTPMSNYDGPANLQITTDLQADLQGYYTFTQPGALGEDSSPGGANVGVPSGPGAAPNPDAVFDGDRGSDVLVLDGIDDNIMIAGRFSTPSSLTLAAWVNVSADNNQEVISIGGSIALRLNDVGFGNGVTGFFNDGSGWQHTDSTQFIGGDVWYHVAYTYDDASNTQTIYIDGIEQATTSYTGSINWAHQTDTTIGSHANQSSFPLDGMVDDARIYDRALSTSEILALANDSASDTAVVSISVDPVNDAPTATNLTSTSPYNEGDASVAITGIVVSDADAGEMITATLTLANTATGSLNEDNGATYNAGTGAWTVTNTVDNVNNALANLVFTPLANNDVDTTIGVVIDDGDEDTSAPLTGTITLDVTPNNPPSVALDDTVILLAENTDTTTRIRVANIDISDDGIGSNILSLSGNDAALFEIAGGALYLRAGVLLDFEAQNRLEVTVIVDDPSIGSNPDDSTALAISIADINEAPVLAFAGSGVDENTDTTDGYVVGVLSASDPDIGDLATFTVVGGADQDKFSINNGNELVLSDGQLDFENQATYEVTLRATDTGNLQHTQTVTITLNDLTETAFVSNGDETTTVTAPTAGNSAAILTETSTFSTEKANTSIVASGESASTSEALPGGSDSSEIVSEEDPTAEELATLEEDIFRDGQSDSRFADAALTQSNNNLDSAMDRPGKHVNLKQLVKAIANLNPATKLLAEAATSLEDAFDFSSMDKYSIVNNASFHNDLNDFRKELQGEARRGQTVVGSAVAASTGVSIGYVVWLVRGGVLLSSVLSSLPAWRLIDPLPVLATVLGNPEEDEDDDESLASMLEREDPEHKEDEASKD